MFRNKILCSLVLFSVVVQAEIVTLEDDNLTSDIQDNASVRTHDVKFAIEVGAKTDFWTPGLSGNVLEYDAEGLFLGFGKLKVKLYDSDVFTLEKYGTLNSSNDQNNLLAAYKDDRRNDTTIDGLHLSLQLMRVLNYLFDKKWLEGLSYEFDTRNFIGDARIKQNTLYWYGKTSGAIVNEDYSWLESESHLSFKTKFTSHKLLYTFDNLIKKVKGSYYSVGLFDEEWSKPTFIGDTGLNGELPIVFDANYYSQGISGNIGIRKDNYNFYAYIDYGIIMK